ncbi:hypothetical protein [Henriciella marina]|jgi:hypothetical protein|uniref:Uncharacterized protein n=1 Tax=Henriciella marina TaxID=453851 RepID=A0ABT4LRR6_9PROT|nr:hypothetical protein [Henriciella marina]MCZ4297057.1 hypothetical protein [Henriciella marina]
MFLAVAPNPHKNGAPTRIAKLAKRGGPVWAIDAEALHRNPELLAPFGRNAPTWIKLADAMSVVFVMLAVMGSFMIGWWMFLPGMALSLALGAVARWLAAHVARKAAKQSYEALLRLHSMQLMWLISN